MKNPWQKLSSKIVYKNPWITVREDKVIRPDGKKGIYGYVQIPHSIVVLAITPKKEIYLVGQPRYPVNVYAWEIPKGGVAKGETPVKAAKRELLEEAGLTAKKWQEIGQAFSSIGIINEVCHIFIAKGLKVVSKKPSTYEVKEIKKIPIKKFSQLILDNKIKDGLTISAAYKLMKYLKI